MNPHFIQTRNSTPKLLESSRDTSATSISFSGIVALLATRRRKHMLRTISSSTLPTYGKSFPCTQQECRTTTTKPLYTSFTPARAKIESGSSQIWKPSLRSRTKRGFTTCRNSEATTGSSSQSPSSFATRTESRKPNNNERSFKASNPHYEIVLLLSLVSSFLTTTQTIPTLSKTLTMPQSSFYMTQRPATTQKVYPPRPRSRLSKRKTYRPF
jgi:hypothetical protein